MNNQTTYTEDINEVRGKINEIESLISKMKYRFQDSQHEFLGKAIKGEAEDGDLHSTVLIVKNMETHKSNVQNLENMARNLRHAAHDIGQTNWGEYVK